MADMHLATIAPSGACVASARAALPVIGHPAPNFFQDAVARPIGGHLERWAGGIGANDASVGILTEACDTPRHDPAWNACPAASRRTFQ